MGSAASKAARKYPKSAKPSWISARTPSHGEVTSEMQEPVLPHASETKTEAIERDAKDPQLLANLSRLGPVNVDHHMRTIRPAADQVQRTFQSRLQSEVEAQTSRPPRNRILASSLIELLDERKQITTPQELESLAARYNMDVAKLERLARYVNSPSIDATSVVKTVGEDGVERTTRKAIWADNIFSNTTSTI